MRYLIRPAREEDNAGILALIAATPQPGRVLLNFERQPAFVYGSQVNGETPDNWVVESAEEPGRIIGIFAVGRRRLFINGRVTTIRYANDLRVAPEYRGSRLLLNMARKLGELMQQGEWMQTVVLTDNNASMQTVASGRAGLPTYHPCGDIQTSMLFSAPMRRHQGLRISQATENELPLMQQWIDENAPRRQFFPCYRLDGLRTGDPFYRGLRIDDYWLAWRGSELVGMAGAWNQKSFKQTRVLAYPRGLGWLRHLYNLYVALRGGIRLPPPGGALNYLTLHSMLVEDDRPDILDALLNTMSRAYLRRFGTLVAGFFDSDPLIETMQGYRRQVLHSRQFLVSYDDNPCASLDGRLPYVEVARL